jgi:ankyrin repeat protein
LKGNDDAVDQLVKSPGINIEEEDEQKLTPLHMACVFGHNSCARLVYGLEL